jgi:hypothetical protein
MTTLDAGSERTAARSVTDAELPEERPDDDVAVREEHPFGLHWLAYAALLGLPIGFFQSDLAGLPGPDLLWEAIWVAVVSVASLVARVVQRRREGDDPRKQFRDEVDAADARHRGTKSFVKY